jgi:hypothetical protein
MIIFVPHGSPRALGGWGGMSSCLTTCICSVLRGRRRGRRWKIGSRSGNRAPRPPGLARKLGAFGSAITGTRNYGPGKIIGQSGNICETIPCARGLSLTPTPGRFTGRSTCYGGSIKSCRARAEAGPPDLQMDRRPQRRPIRERIDGLRADRSANGGTASAPSGLPRSSAIIPLPAVDVPGEDSMICGHGNGPRSGKSVPDFRRDRRPPRHPPRGPRGGGASSLPRVRTCSIPSVPRCDRALESRSCRRMRSRHWTESTVR